jgi:hypothetical protein
VRISERQVESAVNVVVRGPVLEQYSSRRTSSSSLQDAIGRRKRRRRKAAVCRSGLMLIILGD